MNARLALRALCDARSRSAVSGPRQDNSIVFIGRGYRPEDLGRSMRRFLGLQAPEPAQKQAAEPGGDQPATRALR